MASSLGVVSGMNKSSVKRRRQRIGDVVEFPTSKGLVYLQVTHKHRAPPCYSWYARLLPGFFESQPDIGDLVKQREVFGVFCPFLYDYPCVGKFPIPEFAKPFPIFKLPPTIMGPEPPRPNLCWRIWVADEDSSGVTYLCRNVPIWAVDLPIEEIVDDVVLRQRIESGWTPAEGITEAHLNYKIRFEDLTSQPTEEDFNAFCRADLGDVSFDDAWNSGWRPPK
jgi:hypothetical protein